MTESHRKAWLKLLQAFSSGATSKAAKPSRLEVETLEDRLTPSTLDLTFRGAVGGVNGALFRQFDAQPTGTGYINSFVRLQAQGAKQTVQQGYNTDSRPLQFDENNSNQFTRSLRLSELPVVNIGGVNYREVLLDINQKASQPFVSLDDLKVFTGNVPNLHGYSNGLLAGNAPVFNLDGDGDNWIKLDARLNQGSGKGDMLAYIPDSAFAAGGDPYVYLYSKFGVNYAGNAGFEEWAAGKGVLTAATGSISGTIRDQSTGLGIADVVVFLDTNGDGVLNNGEVYTTTNADGQYSFSALATGLGTFTNYNVAILPPAGAVDVTAEQGVLLSEAAQNVTGIDFFVNFVPVGGGGEQLPNS